MINWNHEEALGLSIRGMSIMAKIGELAAERIDFKLEDDEMLRKIPVEDLVKHFDMIANMENCRLLMGIYLTQLQMLQKQSSPIVVPPRH
jgi:hypothetical protein